MNPIDQTQPKQSRERFIEELFAIKKPDNFLLGKKGITKLVDGVEKGFNILKGSYGSAGGNVVVQSDLYPYHESTNDGKKILENIKLTDPYEMIGLNGMKEVADKSDKESGDGRKTAALLYAGILFEGLKYEEHPMDIKRSLEECIPIIQEHLLTQSKGITVDNVEKIASIASENKKLGALFQEIYQQIGSDGIIELDNADLPETSYEVTEGVKLLNCGFMYEYMTNTEDRKKTELKNPDILITKQKVSSMVQLGPVIKDLIKQGKTDLVLFCDEIDPKLSEVLAHLAINGAPIDGSPIQFKVLVIKAPKLWKDWLFEDFAKITGARIINPAEGTTLNKISLSWLGTCDKLATSKKETVVLGTKDITNHVENILSENTDEAKIRASRLKTKTAILKLGAHSESELSHLRGKALDARNSSFQAMESGVLPGGGVSLALASEHLPNTVGGKILKKALKYPMEQIYENLSLKTLPNIVPFPDTIIDATSVVINSMTNAISVAATRLSSKGVIVK